MGSCHGAKLKRSEMGKFSSRESLEAQEVNSGGNDNVIKVNPVVIKSDPIYYEGEHPMARYVFPRSTSLINDQEDLL